MNVKSVMREIILAAIPASIVAGVAVALGLGLSMALKDGTERMFFVPSFIMGLWLPVVGTGLLWILHRELLGPPVNKLTTGMKVSFGLLGTLTGLFATSIAWQIVTGNLSPNRPLDWHIMLCTIMAYVTFILFGFLAFDIEGAWKQRFRIMFWCVAAAVSWGSASAVLATRFW